MLKKFWPWNKIEALEKHIEEIEKILWDRASDLTQNAQHIKTLSSQVLVARARERCLTRAVTSVWNRHFECKSRYTFDKVPKCTHDIVLKDLMQTIASNQQGIQNHEEG